jgi:hypothetical protein
MSAEPWPCDTCGKPGYRNVAANGYCADHLAELYAQLDPSVHKVIGYGLPDGPWQRCVRCGATWDGHIGQACRWCWTEYDSLIRLSKEATLTPPDVDPDDARRPDALRAWAERLAVAVKAELITEQDARTAMQREARRHDRAA